MDRNESRKGRCAAVHLRRLAGTDLKVAASKLTGAEYLQLQHVVETIKTKEKPEIIKTKEEPDAAPPR